MSKMKRREFLVGGATGVAGLVFFNKTLRAAVAAARQANKPLLTERSLNAFTKSNSLRTAKGQRVFAEATNNLDAFIETHFHLTDEQRSELATISAEDRQKLIDAIQQAREKKLGLTVKIVGRRLGISSPKAGIGNRRMSHPVPLKTTTLSIGIRAFGQYIGITITKETKDDGNKNGNGNTPKPS